MTWPVSRTWRVLTGVTPPILVLRHPGPRAVTATDAEHQLVWTLDTGAVNLIPNRMIRTTLTSLTA